MRGVISMMEREKNCREVVTQPTAIRSAVDGTVGLMVASNLEECVRLEIEQGHVPDHVIKEAVDLLVKSR
ncbi:hypothetical protein skT53_33200 [Effusibacillus dendaii]|uniref:Cytoplasmic protein n=1 Tax=Effusibacillus dendaii TaxID=2743772 RepID=A0A7I8DE03_9BACL|nr:hypothetical protein skT53_33200 [Effusibacillus dendaii]